MTKPVVLAIDSGGTAVKILAIDLDGHAVASRTAAVETRHLPDGRVERDPNALWKATGATIRDVVLDCSDREILGVGCTGFGNGVFLVDGDGQPTRPGIVSVDHRAQPLVDALNANDQATILSQVTGNRLWGGQSLMQIAGLAQSEPDVVERTRWALACKDFIRFRLTGEALTDPTDASGGGLLNIESGAYAETVFDALNAAHLLDRLPPIRSSTSVAGRVSAQAAMETGLPKGLRVAGSMMDVAACALGAGAANAPVLTMIAGTWSINGLETRGALPGAIPILNMLFRKGRRLVADGSPCSAANLSWYLENGLRESVTYDQIEALVSGSPIEVRRCRFMPYVFGPEPRRGGFIDLGASDDLGTMLRSILEGVAFQPLRHANNAVALLPESFPPTIRLAGGAARSAVWAQIFADVCQRPVEVVRAPEVGALGVAICAAVACGAFASLEEAASQMTKVGQTHAPDAALATFYEDRFSEFQRLDQSMVHLLDNTG